MNVFLYGRVSTLDQNTDLQKKALLGAYPDGIYLEEKKSGTSIEGREMLQSFLTIMKEDSRLVVWKLDRLARNLHDLTKIVELLNEKGASLEILDQKIDTSTATGRAFLQMLGVFAEFETNLRRERQRAGIDAAKAKGKHLGRPIAFDEKQKREVKAKSEAGMNPSQLSREYNVSRATVYKAIRTAVSTDELIEFQLPLWDQVDA